MTKWYDAIVSNLKNNLEAVFIKKSNTNGLLKNDGTVDTTTKEVTSNKTSSWNSTTNNTRYPTEKLVKDSLDGKANTSHTHSNYLTSHQDISGKVDKAQGSTNASKNVVTDSNGNITTEAKPTIPTKTSQLTNDSNFLTSHQDISGKVNVAQGSTNANKTLSTNSSGNVITEAKNNHTHTKSQISDFPTTMTPSSHTHTKSEITDFPTSMTPTSHTHGNITNAGAIGSASGKIITTTTNGVLQASDSITKSQISDFPTLATVATSGSYNDLSNKPTIPDISGKIDTAGTGLSKTGTTLNHSNSITALTTAALKKIKYDAQGHITGVADVSSSDLPSHTHSQYGVTVEKQTTAESGYIATYVVKQNSSQVGTKINIPKDFLVKSATVNTCATTGTPTGFTKGDKYIDFVVNTKDGSGTDEHIYLNVNDLVDAYTAGAGLELTNSNEFKHSNSVTAQTSAVFKKIKYDGQGHITGTANVSSSDLPSHTHTTSQISDFPTLSTVATSGSYNDLSNKPTIPDISGKVDKAQGTSNSGKFLKVNSSGNVACESVTIPSAYTHPSTHPASMITVDDSNYDALQGDNQEEINDSIEESFSFLATDTIPYLSNALDTKVDTAGTGLSISNTTLNHSNSVTPLTTAALKKVKYDAQGHITGVANVSASDLPSHTHNYAPASHTQASSTITDMSTVQVVVTYTDNTSETLTLFKQVNSQ